jgi:ankyrin repeat protein
MMTQQLPENPNLEFLKKQAKSLLKQFLDGNSGASAQIGIAVGKAATLADAQRAVAKEYGFSSWSNLKDAVEDRLRAINPSLQLLSAIRRDDSAGIKRILNSHSDLKRKLNQPWEGVSFGGTALIEAVGRKDRSVIDTLIAAGADPNVRSNWWAGSFGVLDWSDPDLSAFLMNRGARLDVHSAARLGRFEQLKEMVTADQKLVHARGGDGQTPLHFAANVQIAEYLLDQGADINARDVDHESTPAQYMIHGRQEVVRYLVSRGCETDILMAAALGDLELVRKELTQNPKVIRMSVSMEWFPKRNPRSGGTIYIWTLGWNKTAHNIARAFGHHEVEAFLMNQSPLEVRIAKAAAAADEEMFANALRENPRLIAEMQAADLGELANAAQDSNIKAVCMMLEAGWPVNSPQGNKGATALHWAAWHGNAPMVAAILKHNPELEIREGEFKATPLGWALHGSENGWHRDLGDYPAVVEQLLKAGAQAPKLADAEATDAVLEVLRQHAERNSRT